MSKSLINADLVVAGNIKCKSDLEILGSVTGDINAKMVEVGASGQVDGKVNAESAEIHGTLRGELSVVSVKIHSQAIVNASITAEEMGSDKGARIAGKVNITGPKSKE